MRGQWQQFSHVDNFTGYMEVVARHFAGRGSGLKILDLPAGNGPGAQADRGHVFPLSYVQLRYLFEQHGARVREVMGDRYKKKALLPVYLALLPFAWAATRWLFRRGGDPRYGARNSEMLGHLFSGPVLYSRSLVLVLDKRDS